MPASAFHSAKPVGLRTIVRQGSRLLLPVVLLLAASSLSLAEGVRTDPEGQLRSAVSWIQKGKYGLAHAYLAPVVIHPRITPEGRSIAYYYQGLAFFLQKHYVSAAQAYTYADEFDPANSNAANALAYLYVEGLGVDKDEERARTLFEKAARNGHTEAQMNAARIYHRGVGAEKDLQKARYWYEEAARAGSMKAMIALARALREESDVVEADPLAARDWLNKASGLGSIEASMLLGFMLRGDELGAPDPQAALTQLRAAAEAGNPRAQAAVGFHHMNPPEGDPDYDKALRYIRPAAEAGDAHAQLSLGYIYGQGLGVAQNVKSAKSWYERAAKQGQTTAQLNLAYIYLDASETVNEGSNEAQHRSALDDAISWLRKAADANHPQAMNALAWLLATHPETDIRNGSEAVDLAKAAIDRHPVADYMDTLAAAYAESGAFETATATQEKAIELLQDKGRAERDGFIARLQAYRSEKPWRD